VIESDDGPSLLVGLVFSLSSSQYANHTSLQEFIATRRFLSLVHSLFGTYFFNTRSLAQ
jgi:hypothetical protein